MSDTLILTPTWIMVGTSPGQILSDSAVLVRNGRIIAIDLLSKVSAQAFHAVEVDLPDCLLMPGFVNAHQHGKGLGEVRFGYPDNFLEVWINGRVGRPPLDAYATTLIAAAQMLENGITCAVHANTSFGGDNYESELRECLRAYDESGIRVLIAVGAADRLALVYPNTAELSFLKNLPAEIAQKYRTGKSFTYNGNGQKTIELMNRLLADFAGHPRIRFCYGPAGPQWVSDDLFQLLASDAEKRGTGLHLHCLESLAQAAVCSKLYPDGTLRHLLNLGVLTPRTTLAHSVFLSEEDMRIAAENDVTLVRNPGSNLRLRNGIAPLAHFLEKEIRVAIGSDNTSVCQDEDILKELRLAGLLARSFQWSGSEPPTTRQLVEMLTINGARAAQFDDVIGEIKVGMKADLVAVDLTRIFWPGPQPGEDPIEAVISRAEGRDVVLTMVEGEILYRKGALTKLDPQRLLELASKLLKSARTVPVGERKLLHSTLQEYMTQYYDKLINASAIPAVSCTGVNLPESE